MGHAGPSTSKKGESLSGAKRSGQGGPVMNPPDGTACGHGRRRTFSDSFARFMFAPARFAGTPLTAAVLGLRGQRPRQPEGRLSRPLTFRLSGTPARRPPFPFTASGFRDAA
ncbi:MAG: hypothetical protein DMG57_43910 [Acidobacteria bacterium]|nr:MAG: hypothetical protein DMG57_43910 [Acidobacteriota bacterium]